MQKYLYLFILSVCVFTGCDDRLDSVIPNLPVSLLLRTDTDNLGVAGSYKEVTTRPDATSYLGFGGIIVVRGYDEYSSPYAYDMACPYEKTATTRIKMNSQTMKAECSKCGSTFDGLFWGNPAPSSGPAFEGKLYLRKYSATIRDFNIYINN